MSEWSELNLSGKSPSQDELFQDENNTQQRDVSAGVDKMWMNKEKVKIMFLNSLAIKCKK